MPIFDRAIFDPALFDTGSIVVSVPAGVITLTAPAPTLNVQTVAVPAGVLTLSGPVPTVRETIGIPAGVVTLTGPSPAFNQTVQVPAGVIHLRARKPLVGPLWAHLYAKTISDTWMDMVTTTSPKVAWEISVEETLGEPSTATGIVQDRDGTLDDVLDFQSGRIPILLEIGGHGAGSGIILFQGEWLYDTVHRVAGWRPEHGRYHQLKATDYNRYLGLKLIGAPSGYEWETSDGGLTYQPIESGAHTETNDLDSIQALFSRYWGGPVTVETDTYVHQNTSDTYFTTHPIEWDRTNLDSAMDDLASRTGSTRNVFGWLDQGDTAGTVYLHWVHVPRWTNQASLLASDLDDAPKNIDNDSPDGVSSTSATDLTYSTDGTGRLDDVYVHGATGPAYNFDTPGSPALFGSGWYPGPEPDHSGAEAYVESAGFMTRQEHRTSAGARVLNRTQIAVLRGTMTVVDVDGYHPGQKFSLTDAWLPDWLNGNTYVVQRVTMHFIEGQRTQRLYNIDWGDAPQGRSYAGRDRPKPPDKPSRRMRITWRHALVAGKTADVTGQITNDLGQPRPLKGQAVTWTLRVLDVDGFAVMGEGSISGDSETDSRGQAKATVTAGSTSGRRYQALATWSPT